MADTMDTAAGTSGEPMAEDPVGSQPHEDYLVRVDPIPDAVPQATAGDDEEDERVNYGYTSDED